MRHFVSLLAFMAALVGCGVDTFSGPPPDSGSDGQADDSPVGQPDGDPSDAGHSDSDPDTGNCTFDCGQAACGNVLDSCGNVHSCGTCPVWASCNGAPPSATCVCSSPVSCDSVTCAGKCGMISNGCGGTCSCDSFTYCPTGGCGTVTPNLCDCQIVSTTGSATCVSKYTTTYQYEWYCPHSTPTLPDCKGSITDTDLGTGIGWCCTQS